MPVALAVAIALLVGACGSPVSPTPPPTAAPSPTPAGQPRAGSEPDPAAEPSSAGTPPTPTPGQSAQASCAARVLGAMTEGQRIGQLFSLGLANDHLGTAELSAIRNQHVGSVWFTATTTVGSTAIRAVTTAIQAQATEAATAGVRLFVAANQEGGQIQALQGAGFVTFPSAVVQGGRSISTLTAEAKVWGQQLKAAGVNMDFAPVADVVPPGTDATNQPIGVPPSRVRPRSRHGRQPRGRVHRRDDGRRRGHDRQALPGPRPGGQQHGLLGGRGRQRDDAERSVPRLIPGHDRRRRARS